MKKFLFALCLVVSSLSSAAPKPVASSEVAFDLSDIPVGQVVSVIYKDAFSVPYVLAPEVVADTRRIAFRFGGSSSSVRADLVRLLDSLGYALTSRSGVDFIGPKKESEAETDVFVYRPKFRDVSYLTELLRPLFKGHFTANRSIPAPVGAKSDSPAPVGSAAALVDRAADVLIFNGEAREIKKLEKLLGQVDYQLGEVMVRGVVYEVQTGDRTGSAFALAGSILSGKLSVNLAGASLDNTVKFSIGDVDAVFSALSSDSRFKVVTQPSLRVRSGSQARFSVGQDVPVLGSVTYAQAGVPVQSVEYRSSGVIFNVTPQVRDGAVDLAIEQQLSNFVQTTTGVNTSPTLIKRELRTDVQVREGEVVMLGGLTEEKGTDAHTGLSFLPARFHSKTGSKERTELLLVLQLTKI